MEERTAISTVQEGEREVGRERGREGGAITKLAVDPCTFPGSSPTFVAIL